MQWAGVKKKVKIRSAGPAPAAQRAGPPPRRGPPGGARAGGRGGGPRGGAGGRGGPPAMVDILNPQLQEQLNRAQNTANANDESLNQAFNPGHDFPDEYSPRRPRGPPKPKAVLKAAPVTPAYVPPEPSLNVQRYDKDAAEEEEAMRKADAEFKKSLVLPSLLLIIGLVILAYVVRNKSKIDAERAKNAEIENEDISGNNTGNTLAAETSGYADSTANPKTPEDAAKIEEIYKQKPLPVITEDDEPPKNRQKHWETNKQSFS